MRTYTVKLLSTFFKTWSDQVNYLQNFNYYLPSNFITQFFKSLKYLQYLPNGFQHLENSPYRRLVVNKKYIIIYLVDDIQKRVYVKYVFSGRQDYQKSIPTNIESS